MTYPYGSPKSSGSLGESSGSDGGSSSSMPSWFGSSGSSDQGSSGWGSSGLGSSGSGLSDSSGGGASFIVYNIEWVDTSMGDPSVLEFDVENTGSVPISITSITGTAVGFHSSLFEGAPASLGVGQVIHFSAFTDPGIQFTGTEFTVASDIAGSITIALVE